uniref:Peptidase S1 domain-containing protein n=1 Tax=Anopheles minimus TaxID=112268 RepID=A0A1Y9IVL4_9DIPT
MYLRSVVVLLIAVLVNVESNVIDNQTYETCDDGYCLPKHLCPTGKADDGPILEQNRLVAVRVGEENECGDFMKICCKKWERKTRQVNNKCGVSNPQGLVYNVESELTYAKYAEFPWTVAIFEKPSSSDNPELTHVGGGTLIHPKFVLTTAHTLKDSQRYVARFGEWNMNSDAEAFPTQDIEIEEHILHQSYRVATILENDIALAVLKTNVIYSEHIRPICLPSAQDNFEDQQCIATGWGVDERTDEPATVMKRMELNVISRKDCEMSYRLLDFPYRLHRSIMCGGATDDQNICVKDGGSPLACQRADGSYVLAGIASWRRNCADYLDPGVFMNATRFACWINDTIADREQSNEEVDGNDRFDFLMSRIFNIEP